MNRVFVVFFVCFVALAKSEPPSSYGSPSQNYGTPSQNYGAPSQNYGAPSQNYGAPSQNYGTPGGEHGGGYESNEPKSYEFGYKVKDDYSGSNFHQRETSDGNQVRGEYRVALPDGRTQIVTYWADWASGFHADVRYEGKASYPQTNVAPSTGSGGYNYASPSSQYGAPHK